MVRCSFIQQICGAYSASCMSFTILLFVCTSQLPSVVESYKACSYIAMSIQSTKLKNIKVIKWKRKVVMQYPGNFFEWKTWCCLTGTRNGLSVRLQSIVVGHLHQQL